MPRTCKGRKNGRRRLFRPLRFWCEQPSRSLSARPWSLRREAGGPLAHRDDSSSKRSVLRAAIALLWLSCVLHQPVRADDGDDISLLVRHGAPALAQRLIEQYQSEAAGDASEWARWEKQRIALDVAREQWQAVLDRVAALPAAADAELRQWAATRAAEAELALGQPAAARERLAALIWANEPELGAARLAEWRRLVAETYLAERRTAEADTALRRYLQDTPEPDAEAVRLAARVHLAAGRAEAAAELLAGRDEPENRVWALLADLRSGRHSPETVLSQAQAYANAAATPAELRRAAWAIAAEAAQAAGDAAAQIDALEHAAGHGAPASADRGLPSADADRLWEAYLAYGRELAQRAQLSFDNAEDWFDIEQRLHERKPIEARALMAALAWHAPAAPAAATAHRRLVLSLQQHGRGAALEGLYLQSRRYPTRDSLPVPARYAIADALLARADLAAARQLLGGVPQAADAPVPWQLARARVLLADGSVELGTSVLDALLQQAEEIDEAERRAALRAIGAVQTLGRHDGAVALLHRLAAATPEMALQREVQFALGLSYDALGDHVRAALAYLRTAYLAGAEGADDAWGQRGRYAAAAALARAGLADDARRLYSGLLGADTEPDRRAFAQRALDQLGLVAP